MSTYNIELQQRLETYLADGISAEKAAKQIGISGGLLSTYRKSNYNGNVGNVELKISEFFNLLDAQQTQREKAEPLRPSVAYVPTSVSEDIYAAIRYCQLEKGMVILHGDAGIGKTKAAEKYTMENPSTTIYLQISPSTGALGSFLRVLARAMHIAERRSKLDLVMDIRDKLEGTNKVLIIDEAQHLKLTALEEIRTLGDPNMMSGKGGIGIVLIGNSEVYDRMCGKAEARFAQLFSRIRMNRLYSTRDIKHSDTEKLFPLLAERGMKKELNFLYSICQSRW
ncbi:MAG: AAA family ATPase, partial [Ruthenibacterium sp.]